MAWNVGLGRARWWLGAALGMGCTAPNPAFDGDGGTGTQGGPTTGTIAEGTQAGMETGSNDSTGEVGSDSGLGACEEPAMGVEVSVTLAGGEDMCGAGFFGTGLLVASQTGYTLYRGPACLMTEPIPIVFQPKGPSITTVVPICVDYELRYRADCSFDSAVIRDVPAAGGGLIYAAATVPESNVPNELTLEEKPVGDVCNCELARCCASVPPPGPYGLLGTPPQGESQLVVQGDQTTFTSGSHMYELGVTQARVTDQCDDPMQFDWYYRKINPA